MFNVLIIFFAGFVNDWPHALYSALAIFINGRVMDSLYTRQQRLQVMIVTARPKQVVREIQGSLRRGITIVHDAEAPFITKKRRFFSPLFPGLRCTIWNKRCVTVIRMRLFPSLIQLKYLAIFTSLKRISEHTQDWSRQDFC